MMKKENYKYAQHNHANLNKYSEAYADVQESGAENMWNMWKKVKHLHNISAAVSAEYGTHHVSEYGQVGNTFKNKQGSKIL